MKRILLTIVVVSIIVGFLWWAIGWQGMLVSTALGLFAFIGLQHKTWK